MILVSLGGAKVLSAVYFPRGKMADTLTPEQRSERMSRIRGKDTKPERVVRRVLTDLGYRYRLNVRRLPGAPDIAFIGRRKAIWIHGCFWHQHKGCKLGDRLQ